MPGGSIRIANADIAFSANTADYTRGLQQMRAQNLTMQRSFIDLSRPIAQFTESIRSSLIATVAYAAGVGAIIGGTERAASSFIQFEAGLTSVQKTADLTVRETERLGDAVNRLVTEQSVLGGPLPILRQDLLEILDVAGQMNITGIPNLRAFGEAVGLLTLTTDLQGARAADALGSVIANTRAAADESLGLASAITRLGNVNRGGEAGIIGLAERLAQGASRFDLAAEDILAVAATLSQRSLQPELAGTAFQRTLSELQDAANAAIQGNDEVLREVARNLDTAYGSIQDRIELLLQTIDQGDFVGGLKLLLEAFSNAGPRGSGGLITTLFGGESPPARISAFLGSLSLEQERLARNTRLAAEEMESQNAIIREASLFADDAGARLQIVGNQLQQQATRIGGFLVGAFLPVAENFRAIEVAAVAVGTALASSFGRSYIQRAREANEASKQQSQNAISEARTRAAASIDTIRANREIQSSYRNQVEQTERLRRAQERVAQAQANTLSSRRVESQATATLDDANRRRLQAHYQLLRADLNPEQDRAARLALMRAEADRTQARNAIQFARTQVATQENVRVVNQRIIDSYQQGNVTLTDYRNATRRIADAEKGLARNREIIANNLRNLQRGTTLYTRTLGRLRNVYNAIGGLPGLLITGLTTGLALLANFGRRAADEARRVQDNMEDLRNEIRRSQELQLSPQGDALRRVESDLENLRRQADEIRRQIEQDQQRRSEVGQFRQQDLADELAESPFFRGLGDSGETLRVVERRLEGINRQAIVLNELVVTGRRAFGSYEATLREASQRIGQFFGAANRVGDGLVTTFRRLELSLEGPTQRIREFQEQLQDVTNEAIRQSQLDFEIAGLDPEEQNRQILVFQEQLAIRQRQIQAERDLRDARENVDRATVLRDIAQSEAQRVGIATELGEEAAKQAAQAQRNLDAAILILRAKQAEVFFTRDLTLEEGRRADLARQAAAARQAEIAAAVNAFVPAVRPDFRSVELGVEEEIAAIRRSVEEEERAAQQRVAITNRRTREQQAALAAQFETQNRYDQLRQSAIADFQNSQQRLVNVSQRLNDIDQQRLITTGNQLDALLEERNNLRQTREALIAEVAERGRAIGIYDQQAEALERLAQRRGELAAAEARIQAIVPEVRPDTLGAQREADEQIQGLRRIVRERQRAAIQQLRIRSATTQEERAALEGQFRIENRFNDLRLTAIQDLADARRQLADTTTLIAQVESELQTATGPRIGFLNDEIDGLRRLQAQQVADIQTRQVSVSAIERQTGTVQELAQSIAALSAQAAQTQAFIPAARPDFRGVELQIEDEIAAIRRTVEEEERAAAQRVAITSRRTREQQAALQAQLETENTFNDLRITAIEEYETAQQRLVNVNRLLADIARDRQTASANELDALIEERAAAVQTREALIAEVAERRRAIGVLDAQADAFDEFARRRADLARAEARREDVVLPVRPDFAGAQREADEQIQQIRRVIEERRRAAAQRRDIEGAANERERVGLEAQFEIEDQFRQAQIQTLDRVDAARRRLADSSRLLATVESDIQSATGPRLARLLTEQDQLRNSIANQTAEVETRQRVVEALRDQAGAAAELAQANRGLAEQDIRGPLEQYRRDLESVREEVERLSVEGIQGFSQELTSAIFEADKSFTDFFENIGQRLIQLLFEAVLVQNVLSAISAGVGALGIGSPGPGPEIFHSGGIAGRAAQRRPFGRAMLRPGERLAIILDDEEVLTSRDPRHRWNVRSQSYEDLRAYISRLPRHHEGRGPVSGQSGATMGAAPMNVRFELINETASPARAVDGGNRFDGDTFVQTVILRDFRASGPISQAVKSLPRR